MEVSKILTVVILLFLLTSLLLSAVFLISLRKAVEENNHLQQNARRVLHLLEEQQNVLTKLQSNQNTEDVSKDETSSDQATDVEASVGFEAFCLRTVGEKIGVYTADGTLLLTLEIRVDTLPAADREALQNGIAVDSPQKLLALLRDYTD